MLRLTFDSIILLTLHLPVYDGLHLLTCSADRIHLPVFLVVDWSFHRVPCEILLLDGNGTSMASVGVSSCRDLGTALFTLAVFYC